MRLLTYEMRGEERLGVLVAEAVLDLYSLSRDAMVGRGGLQLPSDMLSFLDMGDRAMERARELLTRYDRVAAPMREDLSAGSAVPLQEVRVLAPIPRPRKNVFALGWNYAEHLAEGARARGREQKLPEYPVFFTKAPTSVIGPGAPILYDERVSTEVDWEAELAVVIGTTGRNIPRDRACDYVAGYTVINDVSARNLQFRHGQWFKGKSVDSFCPMGPFLVTRDEVPDAHQLHIEARVNGVVKQNSNTRFMIFNIPAIIESLSLGMTLEPGDIISTGTPEGVGFARKPPEFLKPGDVVEVEVTGIGALRNPVALAF